MSDTKSSVEIIKCPNCGQVIPISEALRRQVAEEARASLQKEMAPREQALADKEERLSQKEASLKKDELMIEARLQERLKGEREKLRSSALEAAKAEVAVQLEDFQKDAASRNKELKKLRDNELQLLQEKRQLQLAKESLELDVARKVGQERAAIREQALKEADEKHQLKDAERDLQLAQARKANEELRRKLEQGSQQLQGEVLELDLEHFLRNENPYDDVSEVAKGVYGADLLQVVNSRNGLTAGTIIWEAKNTKNWSDAWIAKLKADQMSAKADTAVIVSEALPKGIDGFGFKDGVWVTSRKLVPALTLAIRHTLLEVAHARRAAAGKNEVVEALFKYATGPEFRNRVETIVRNFHEMKEDLEAEKKQTTRRWAKRSKQLDLIIVNTAGMYGDFQGLIGSSMQDLPALEGDQPEMGGVELAASAED